MSARTDFIPINIAILTVSDTRTLQTDTSGSTLTNLIVSDHHVVIERAIVRDDRALIRHQLQTWIEKSHVQVILTTGGTGVTGRDVTPEAVQDVMDFEIPGFGELFRWLSYQTIGTSTIQSRALGARANGTLIFSLPGSQSAVTQAWTQILRNQLDARHQPCNFAALLPRLKEN